MGRPIYSPSFEPYTTTQKNDKKHGEKKLPPKAKLPPTKPSKTPK